MADWDVVSQQPASAGADNAPTTDWTPVSQAPVGPPALMRTMPDFKSENDYQGWVRQHLEEGSSDFSSNSASQSTTVDPYGNGSTVDLRRMYADNAAPSPITGQNELEPDDAMMDKYQMAHSPTLTKDSIYAGNSPSTAIGSWSDPDENGQRTWQPPGWTPASDTKQAMDKAVKLATGTGKDITSAVSSPDFFSPEKTLDNAEDTGLAALKGMGGDMHGLQEDVNIVGGAFPVLYDKAKSLFTGKDTTDAQDAWFASAVDPLKSQDDAFDLAKNAGLPEKVAHEFGSMVTSIDLAVLTGGESAPLEAGASGMDALKAAAEHGTKSMAIPATQSAIDTGRKVYEETGDGAQALKAAQMQWLVTSVGGYVPLSGAGSLPSRLAQGAVAGTASSETGRQVMNTALPQSMQQDFDPSNIPGEAAAGAVMGGMGGHAEPAHPDYQGGGPEHPDNLADNFARAGQQPPGGPAGSAPGLAQGADWTTSDGIYKTFRDAMNAHKQGDSAPANATIDRLHTEADNAEAAGDHNRAQDMRSIAEYMEQQTGGGNATSAAGKRTAQDGKTALISMAARDAGDIKAEASDDGATVTVSGRRVADFQSEGAANRAVDDARQAVEDRRVDDGMRKKVGDMTPDEMRKEMLTHELTGLPNRRAFDEDPRMPGVVSIDANSLKWINDEGGHEAGDHLLKAIGTALQDESPHSYHLGGDEFALQAKTPEEAEASIQRVKQRLAGAKIEMVSPTGHKITVNGIGISHGTGSDFTSADRALQHEKSRQATVGLRAARGEQPPGTDITPPEAGLPGQQDNAAHPASVLGQSVERPAQPTPAQAKAGNYKKADVQYHGLPIKVENVEGQYRTGTNAKGQVWKNRMKGADYGYFKGTKANDGDGVDVFMGKQGDTGKAYVIDQVKPDKSFDEHKVVVGVNSTDEADKLYHAHYQKGWKGFGGITELSNNELKNWLKAGDQSRPLNLQSVAPPKVVRGLGPDARHDSVLQYLARHPKGLNSQEAVSQGIDPADMALAAAHVGIKRAFRKGGMSFDHAAETLHQEGYPVADEQGHYSPNVLLDKISDELRGKPQYSTRNESHIPEATDLEGWRHAKTDDELEDMTSADLEKLHADLEAAAERAAIQREEQPTADSHLDDIPFAKADDFSLSAPGGRAGTQAEKLKKGGEQQDLFGDKVAIKNELERVKAALDAKRNKGQMSAETGRPGDLFSQANRQTNLEDKQPADRIHDKLVRFASGMSRLGDIRNGTHATAGSGKLGIGVDVGELSSNAISEIAHAVAEKGADVFVDSGAFSLFRKGLKADGDVKPLDFDAILKRYDEIERRVAQVDQAEEGKGRVLFVMPDIVGDQKGSLDLLEKYKGWIKGSTNSNRFRAIVPIQKGDLSLAAAYRKAVDILGTNKFITGVPSNEAAVSPEDLKQLLAEKPAGGIHFLGAIHDSKMGPKIKAMVEAKYEPSHFSADGNLLRSALWGRGGKDMTRGEAVQQTLLKKAADYGSDEAAGALKDQMDLATEADNKWSPLEPLALMQRTPAELHEYIAGALERHMDREAKEGEAALKWVTDQATIEKTYADKQHPVIEDHPYLTGKPREKAGLQDAGTKIGGARKDKWAERGMRLTDLDSMTEGEAAEYVNKKAVWNPQWSKLIEAGMPREVAAVGKVLMDQLAAKPRNNTPTGRRDYVETLGRVRDQVESAKTIQDLQAIEGKLIRDMGVPTGYAIASTPEQMRARDQFWSIQKGRRSTLRPQNSDVRKAIAMITAGWPNVEPWSRRFDIRQTGNETWYLRDKKTGKTLRDQPYSSVAMAREAAQNLLDREDAAAEDDARAGIKPKEEKPKEPDRPHLDKIERVGPPARDGDATPQHFIDHFGFRGLEFGNWAANDERQRLLNHAYDALEDLSRALEIPPKALSLNGTMGLALAARGGGRFAAHYESHKLVINMTKLRGAGALAHEWGHALDHYMGEYGRSDAYQTGARGATGWRADPTARTLAHLRPEMQEAWKGVMDAMFERKIKAAEAMRDAQLSLETARSQRRDIEASIKEQPDDNNLATRLEWIDGRMKAIRDRMNHIHANPDDTFGTRPTEYKKTSADLGDYWRRPNEMFARAFESFVYDKLHAAGQRSDYLVHSTTPEVYEALGLRNPYPAEDRPAISAAIQKLADTLDTRSEGGNEVLFKHGSSDVSPAAGNAHLDAVTVSRSVAKYLDKFSVKPGGVRVADSMAELLKDPEIGPILEAAGATADNRDRRIAFVHPRTQKLYFIADQIHSLDHVASLVAHEYITHFGLRAALGDARNPAYQAILDGVGKALPGELADRGRRYFGHYWNPNDRTMRNEAAEEALASYSEAYSKGQTVPDKIRRWLDKLHAMIRDWLRKTMGLPKKFDELFIKRTLADLETFLRNGGGTAKAGVRSQEPAFAGQHDTFYSGLAKAVDAAKREKGTGAEWEATLRNMPGVKAEELEWTGIKDWLAGQGKVSKQEVADYVAAHRVELGEVTYGGNGEPTEKLLKQISDLGYRVDEDVHGNPELVWDGRRDTDIDLDNPDAPDPNHAQALELLGQLRHGDNPHPQYQEWATPGGENYREMLMTLKPSEEAARAKQNAKMMRALSETAKADHRVATRDLMDLYGSDLLGRTNTLGQLIEASDPDSELHATAKIFLTALGKQKEKDGGPALVDRAIETAGRVEFSRAAMIAADKANQTQHNYQSSHWDPANVLAHTRFDDRTGPNGEKILHIHEVQSDWHQTGRKSGYQRVGKSPTDSEVRQFFGIRPDADMNMRPGMMEAYRQEMMEHPEFRNGGVPDAPFKTSWPELVMKRMLRMAVEGGYDKLSWDTGETNADRYDMRKHVGSIEAEKTVHGNGRTNTYQLHIRAPEGATLHRGEFQEAALDRNVGKELGEKIRNQPPGKPVVKYQGLDLKVGGEGMRSFYDEMLPKKMQSIVKKWGSSVESGHVNGEDGAPKYIVDRATDGDWVAVNTTNSYDFHEFDSEAAAQAFVDENKTTDFGQIPAHTVPITDKMRDSVMGGQPMFAKGDVEDRRTKERDTLFGREGAGGTTYGMVRRGAAATVDNELVRSFTRIVNPRDVSDVSKQAASLTRAFLGELAHQKTVAQEHLQQFTRSINRLSQDDQLAMIHAIETGAPQPIPGMQPIADAMRKMLDTWRDHVRSLGTGNLENYIENYFPHWWKDQPKAKSVFASIQGRRTMSGPKTFLKKRTIPTTKEGIEYGLTPITTNPLVLTLLKINEMQRYVSGVSMLRGYKDTKTAEGGTLAEFLPTTKSTPEGWKEIDDPIARVSSWSEAEGGFVQRGRYIMPTDAARIVNNHLSASKLANFMPAQIIRSGANILNAMQLGFSAFHLGFTTLDAMISKNAIALERLASGEPLRALAAFGEGMTPVGAAMNIARGIKLMNAYTNPSGATPEMKQLVNALTAAGGRVHMDRFYLANEGVSPFRGVGPRSLAADMKQALTQPHGKMIAATKAIGSFPVDYAQQTWNSLAELGRIYPAWQWPLELVGRTTRASSAWIMEHIVPMQKLGVFSDLAQDWLRRNPDATPDEMTKAMQNAWDSVDNRLGEMVYDNLFWDRTFKDATHLAVRAVGWNAGTIREIGGAPQEVLQNVSDAIRDGKMPKLGHKAAYVMSLYMTTALLSAVVSYFYGTKPKELKDYLFPRTGRFQADGTPERISFPSYVKDVYEYANHPGQTLMHKANPWIGVLNDEITNTDYFGHPIYNATADEMTQWRERMEYVGKAFRPFSWSGQKNMVGSEDPGLKGLGTKVLPYVGVTPAPALITKPEKMEQYQHYQDQVNWKKKLQFDLKKARATGDKAAVQDIQRQLNEMRPAELREHNEYLRDKAKTKKDATAGKTSALLDHVGPLIDSSSSRAEMAQKIHAAGYPALAGLIGSLPETLRPQVADAIERNAT